MIYVTLFTLIAIILKEKETMSNAVQYKEKVIITNDYFKPIDKVASVSDTVFKFIDQTPLVIYCNIRMEGTQKELIMNLESANVWFEGCKGLYAGAIQISRSQIKCVHCNFYNCFGGIAGGIYSRESTIHLLDAVNINCTSSNNQGMALFLFMESSDSISKIEKTQSKYSDNSEILNIPLCRFQQLPIAINEIVSNSSATANDIIIERSVFLEMSNSYFSPKLRNTITFANVNTAIILNTYFGANQHISILSTEVTINNCTFVLPFNEAIANDGKHKISISNIQMAYFNESFFIDFPSSMSPSKTAVIFLIFSSIVLIICTVLLFFCIKPPKKEIDIYNELPSIDDESTSSLLQ